MNFAAVLLGITLLWAPGVPPYNVPEDVHYCFERNALLSKYDISTRVNPFYLRGDFDGDGKPDYAVAILQKNTSKPGLVICNSSSPQAFVLGAGTDFADEDALDFDGWQVHEKSSVREGAGGPAPKLTSEAIWLQLDETASGIVYWDGKNYAWYLLTE